MGLPLPTQMISSYKTLPSSPGVYFFKNKAGRVLYVGKAKNLRARVKTYFQRPQELEPHKQLMMPQVAKVEHLVTGSEIEALLLEANLIKKNRPKYNILLKDDKSYKYIKIDYSVDFPKIYFVRQPHAQPASRLSRSKSQDKYFGPFTDGYAANQALELMRQAFRWRTCDRDIPYDGSAHYRQPCLYYHIKLCSAPCINKINRPDYERLINDAIQFLKGRSPALIKKLTAEMHRLSRLRLYEKAALKRDQINHLKKITSQRQSLATAAEQTATDWTAWQQTDPAAAWRALQKLVGLPARSHRLEAYDISNIQGTAATGSLVVFANGQARKSEYRRFAIRLKTTPDDVSMMGEMLTRRLKHLDKGWPKPDLILVDGGKPQLNLARRVLKALKLKIPVISLAKREEEIFVPGRAKPIQLPHSNPTRLLLQQVRDEAHRFAISYHINLRRKKSFHSPLDDVPGIGPKTKKLLLRKFGTVAAIKRADPKSLKRLIGPARTKTLLEQLPDDKSKVKNQKSKVR